MRKSGRRAIEYMAVQPSIEELFLREHGRIIATLIRFCVSFHLAEEAMQEAFAAAVAWTRTARRALVRWHGDGNGGIPDETGNGES